MGVELHSRHIAPTGANGLRNSTAVTVDCYEGESPQYHDSPETPFRTALVFRHGPLISTVFQL
jgi:hypothetical protein